MRLVWNIRLHYYGGSETLLGGRGLKRVHQEGGPISYDVLKWVVTSFLLPYSTCYVLCMAGPNTISPQCLADIDVFLRHLPHGAWLRGMKNILT